MCKQCEDAARNPDELNGDALEKVTGGGGDPFGSRLKCYFTAAGPEKEVTQGGNVGTYMLCSSECFPFLGMCDCHGKDHCKDKWHKVDDNKELLPYNAYNHADKKAANNYNT